MRDIFEKVSSSPRLRRFSTSYMILYLIITMSISLIGKLLPVVNTFAGGYVKTFVVYLIEGALLFGLVRGICDKDYKLSRALSSFSESENYVYYLAYALAKTVYDVIAQLVSRLAAGGGAFGAVGWVLMITLTVFGFILNFALVRLYFEKIIYKNTSLDIKRVVNCCIDTVKNKPGRIASAEIMMLVVNYVSALLATFLATPFSEEPIYWAVSFVASALLSIRFGALIYSWPVYYLYYKETCEQ